MKDHMVKLSLVAMLAATVFGSAAIADEYAFLTRTEVTRPVVKEDMSKYLPIDLLSTKVTKVSQVADCPCGADCPCARIAKQVQGDRAKYVYTDYGDGSWKATPREAVRPVSEIYEIVRETPRTVTVYADDDTPSYGSNGGGGYSVVRSPVYAAPRRGYWSSGGYTQPVRTGIFGGRIFRGGSCANGQCGL